MNNALSQEQLRKYERDGFLFPIAVLSPDELAKAAAVIEKLENHLGGTLTSRAVMQPHLHFRWAYDLATHPKVLGPARDIIGPNILIHSSTLFIKYPHNPNYVSWHQDGHYWQLSAPHVVSAWIALTDSTIENGCLRVVRGSHKQSLPHYEQRSENNLLSTGLHVAVDVDEQDINDVTLKAGDMSLHHVNMVHGSKSNESAKKRIGYAIRLVAAGVKQVRKHHTVVLACGRDDYHYFELLKEPPTDDIEEGLDAAARFVKNSSGMMGVDPEPA